MKVALVHDWLTGMRGGEKVLEVLCDLFPDADVYTLLHRRGSVSPSIEKHPIHTSFIQGLPFSSRYYRYYLPFFPSAIETFRLNDYELVISSSHCVAMGVRTSPDTCHIAYIHTPMRYIWDQFPAYFGNGRGHWLSNRAISVWLPYLRKWDVASSRRPGYLIASSSHVAGRIQKYYNREATVIHPPVDTSFFRVSAKDEGFYLMVTAFAPYKRVDLAVEAFNQLGYPLKIIGTGQDESRLRRKAGPTVEFLGWRTDHEVREAYSACRAVIFPGLEDFGIVPLEAMASGKPVIAYGCGGVLETVTPLQNGSGSSPTGVFFYEQTAAAIIDAVRRFEEHLDCFNPVEIRKSVQRFDRGRFKEKLYQFIEAKIVDFHGLTHAQEAC